MIYIHIIMITIYLSQETYEGGVADVIFVTFCLSGMSQITITLAIYFSILYISRIVPWLGKGLSRAQRFRSNGTFFVIGCFGLLKHEGPAKE